MERTLDWTPRKRHQKRICQDHIKELLPGETSEGVEKPDKGRGGSQARVWLQLDCTLRELGSRRSWAFICPTHQSLLIATVVEPETQERMLVTQSCPTPCDPMDCSPPSSSVHGILQARILEEAAIPFSRGLSQPRDQTRVSCIASRFLTVWATREAFLKLKGMSHSAHLGQVALETQWPAFKENQGKGH